VTSGDRNGSPTSRQSFGFRVAASNGPIPNIPRLRGILLRGVEIMLVPADEVFRQWLAPSFGPALPALTIGDGISAR